MAFLESAIDVLSGVQNEIAVFVFAISIHALLFGRFRFMPPKGKAKVGSSKSLKGHSVPLTPAVQSSVLPLIRKLLRQDADSEQMARELAGQLGSSSPETFSDALVATLEGTRRTSTPELLAAVRGVLRERGLQPSSELVDALLRGYCQLCLHSEFDQLLAEVQSSGDVLPKTAILALRSALRRSNLEDAKRCLRQLAGPLKAAFAETTASNVPQQLIQQLVQLAVNKAALPDLLRELCECGLFAGAILDLLFLELARGGNKLLLREAEMLARARSVPLSERAYAAMIRGYSAAKDALSRFAEAAERNLAGAELVTAAAEAAVVHGNAALAEAALRHLPAKLSPELAAALVRLTAEGPGAKRDAGKAVLDLYEERCAGVDVTGDPRAGQIVAEAALRQERLDVLGRLLSSVSEPARQVALLKGFGERKHLADAMKVFQSCPEKTACLYNALLAACNFCEDAVAGRRVAAEAKAAGMADVVTYNTIIKYQLQHGDFEEALSTIQQMKSKGGASAPNCVTFNELLDASIKYGSKNVWRIVDDMKACNLEPNTVTCSILLKNIYHGSKASDIDKVMEHISNLESGMDEVLLSSICEAFVRAGRADLLRWQLLKQRGSSAIPVRSPYTFGSVIRAYGFMQDPKGAWDTWKEMRCLCIIPTSVTIGCMVEALVQNGDIEGGLQLIREIQGDAQMQPLVNAIIYCSVIKGFCHQKQFDRVWAVREEMLMAKVPLSAATYNALIDACVRSSEMSRVHPLLQEMTREGIAPNVITYSTVLKGYCQDGRLDTALALLEDMKRSTSVRPDEITYNTLIDGCARVGGRQYNRGLQLLEEMQQAGVRPSAFTLSVVAKLAVRSGRAEDAFKLCSQLSQKHKLRLNVHVYNNLISACLATDDFQRAMGVLEQMLRENARPDVRTYALLLRNCMRSQNANDMAGLLRAATGVRGAHPRIAGFGAAALLVKGCLPADLVTEVIESIQARRGDEELAMQLLADLRRVPGLKLDARLSLPMAFKTGQAAARA
mmetsp:Transcript_35468/g.101269  ORF Transcript_35468/g.101269 Transcript_35468/m.101269 type:complete len:1015 (-) Transcript_35468:46-3090(-)